MDKSDPSLDDMPTSVDFGPAANPVIGKYANRLKGKVTMVVLDADVAERFPNSEIVNEVLRSHLTDASQATGG
jgi:hypothetical protein